MAMTQLPQSDRQAHYSEHDFRCVIDAVPALVWSALPDGTCDFVNLRWLEYTGFSLDQALAGHWDMVVHPADLDNFKAQWRSALATGQPLAVKVRLRSASGAYRWFLMRAAAKRNAQDMIAKWYGTGTDIENHDPQDTMLNGENRVHRMLAKAQQLSHTGSFSWQPASADIAWSEETFRIYGLSPAIKPTLDLVRQRIHPEDLSVFEERLRHAPDAGQDFTFEHRLLMPNGEVKYVKVTAHAVRNETGDLVEFYGAVMDVTNRHLAQRSLERAFREMQALKNQFQLAVDTIPGLVWSALPDGHIDFLNQRWREYTGLSLDTASGWGWRAAIHPADLPALETYWKSLLASGRPGEAEVRMRRHDGDYRWFLFRAMPLYDNQNKLLKWYGQTTDIDDRKRAEEQLRQSERNLAEGQRLTKTGSWVLDFKTGNTNWSVETCRIFGFPDPPPSPHYSEFRARVHLHDRAGVDLGLRESFETGEPRPLDYRFILPDGTRKNIETISQPVKDETGAVLRLMGTVMDVTERKQAEETLQASELLARGQLEALIRTLDSLAKESEPDKLLEHVLRTILAQSDAHSVNVWDRNTDPERFDLVATLENGRFQTQHDPEHPVSRLPSLAQNHPVWLDLVRSRQHAVLKDIDKQTAQLQIGSEPDCREYQVLADTAIDSGMADFKQYFYHLGVRVILFVPLVIAGEVTGLIGVRFVSQRTFRREEIELTKALAHQATLAMQLIRLSRQSRQAAIMAERNRLARDIHDTLAQGFTGVIIQLEAAADASTRGLQVEADEHLALAGNLARESLQEARLSVLALRPQSLEDKNLCEALDELIRKMTRGIDLQATFSLRGQSYPLPAEWEANLLHIGQEVLTNALRHAQASTFSTQLSFGEHALCLELCDNGCGFDQTRKHEGFGLLGIRERVQSMGGHMAIESAQGRGTRIIITLPVTATPSAHYP